MIVDGSQILMSFPFILVAPAISDAVFFFNDKAARMGTVIDVYSGCDWVLVDNVVGYKTEGVEKVRFANTIYDLVPKENILLTYIASLA